MVVFSIDVNKKIKSQLFVIARFRYQSYNYIYRHWFIVRTFMNARVAVYY